MSQRALDPADPAMVYDCALRFTIPSASRPHECYMVDLDCYRMNGKCDCPHFACRLEPILARGITPAQAIAEGLVKPSRGQHEDDVLRCKHIVDAYRQFSVLAATAISNAKKIKTTPAKEALTPF